MLVPVILLVAEMVPVAAFTLFVIVPDEISPVGLLVLDRERKGGHEKIVMVLKAGADWHTLSR